ncbi:MAG: N-acetylmuramoyl-L-alanine amidase, partial [Candidatus Binatia bacterium]
MRPSRLRAALAAGIAIAVAVPAAQGGARRSLVERIRYVGTVSYSRVVVDLSAPARYSVMSVPGDGEATPVNRLVIDVAGARIGPEAKEPLTIGDALLQRIRPGQYTLDTARIVLDFRATADHRVFTLPDPYRLVIDMRGQGLPSGRDAEVLRLDSAEAGGRPRSAPPSAEPERAARPPGPGDPHAGRPLKVMIDPGHGGKDPGARGVGGVVEKDIVLAVARELAARLRREHGIEVL